MRKLAVATAIGCSLALALPASAEAPAAKAEQKVASASDAAPIKQKPVAAKSEAPVSTAAVSPDTKPSAPAAEAAEAKPDAAAEKPKPRPAKPVIVATIDLTKQRMRVSINGKGTYTWKISSGRSGYATPPGRFSPTWMSKMHYSKQYDLAPMPYSVFFNRGIAVHGTNATGALGRPASHGCIRLTNSNARRFFNLVKKHGSSRTRIIVTGKAPATRNYVAQRRPQPSYNAGYTWSYPGDNYGYSRQSRRSRNVYSQYWSRW